MRILALLACLVLAGCATTRTDANYSAYLEAHTRAEQNRAIAEQALADASACNGEPSCVISVKAIAGLAIQGGGANRHGVQQHVRQPGAAERITLGLLGLGERLGPAHYGYKAQRVAIEGNVEMARINAGREVAMIEAVAVTTNSVAELVGLIPPGTNIEVQGDYIPGHVGDWRTGDDVRRDTIGRDRIDNAGNLGNGNRQSSPDDYSTDCEGPGCQGVNRPITNPLPDPEG